MTFADLVGGESIFLDANPPRLIWVRPFITKTRKYEKSKIGNLA